jgi:hypothetical protein
VRPRLLTATVTAALALTLVGSAPAFAADGVYPPAGVRVVTGLLSAEQVAEGGQVTFSGRGFAPGTLLRLSVDGVDVRTEPADASGAFATPVTLMGIGEHVLAASGLESAGRVRVVSATATVKAEATAGALGATGSDVLPALGGGLVLVLLGAGAVFAAKARTSRRAAPTPITIP